jgi:hypothetical protein
VGREEGIKDRSQRSEIRRETEIKNKEKLRKLDLEQKQVQDRVSAMTRMPTSKSPLVVLVLALIADL